MDLTEIITRKSPYNISQDEMCYVVEQYIKDKKSYDISINIEKRVIPINMLRKTMIVNQLQKLNQAFDIAQKYFVTK